jgi:hypothetical protein
MLFFVWWNEALALGALASVMAVLWDSRPKAAPLRACDSDGEGGRQRPVVPELQPKYEPPTVAAVGGVSSTGPGRRVFSVT